MRVRIYLVKKWSWYIADPFCRILVYFDFVTTDQYADYIVDKHMKVVIKRK